MEWRPARWSVCLPLLISPCTIKSRSSLLAPAHMGGPGKRAVKRLWCGVVPNANQITLLTLHPLKLMNLHFLAKGKLFDFWHFLLDAILSCMVKDHTPGGAFPVLAHGLPCGSIKLHDSCVKCIAIPWQLIVLWNRVAVWQLRSANCYVRVTVT